MKLGAVMGLYQSSVSESRPLKLWNRSCAFKCIRISVWCLCYMYGTAMVCGVWYTGIFGTKKWATVFSYLFSCLLRGFSLRFPPLLYVICLGLFSSFRILYCHLFSFARDKRLLHLDTLIYRRMNDIIFAVLFSRKLCYFDLKCDPGFVPFHFPGAR